MDLQGQLAAERHGMPRLPTAVRSRRLHWPTQLDLLATAIATQLFLIAPDVLATECVRASALPAGYTLTSSNLMAVPRSDTLSREWRGKMPEGKVALQIRSLQQGDTILTVSEYFPRNPSPSCSAADSLREGQTLVYLFTNMGSQSLRIAVVPGSNMEISIFSKSTPSVKPGATPGRNQSVAVTVKSFIQKVLVDPVRDGEPISNNNSRRLGFDAHVGGRSHALAMALLTDKMFSENPQTPSREAHDYRLWSKLTLAAQCTGDWITDFAPPNLETAFGQEGPLDSAGKVAQQPRQREVRVGRSISQMEVSYEVAGRPNLLALPAFEAIRPRSCVWIWHKVDVKAACQSGQLAANVSISGSAFPSHQAWVDDQPQRRLEQATYESLWICDRLDSTRVK